MLVVKVPVDVVPAITLSVSVGVALALLHTIPLCVTFAPPSLTIDPPEVAPLVVMLVNAAVVTKGTVGGGASSFLQPEAIINVRQKNAKLINREDKGKSLCPSEGPKEKVTIFIIVVFVLIYKIINLHFENCDYYCSPFSILYFDSNLDSFLCH